MTGQKNSRVDSKSLKRFKLSDKPTSKGRWMDMVEKGIIDLRGRYVLGRK